MTEIRYLPIRESVGYKNIKRILRSIFSINLDEISIRDNLDYENFGFSFQYRNYPITMMVTGTGKNIQFEFGEGGELSIFLPDLDNSLWGESELYELVLDKTIKDKLKHIFCKNEKSVEFAMQVLKDYLDKKYEEEHNSVK